MQLATEISDLVDADAAVLYRALDGIERQILACYVAG